MTAQEEVDPGSHRGDLLRVFSPELSAGPARGPVAGAPGMQTGSRQERRVQLGGTQASEEEAVWCRGERNAVV